MKEIVFWLAYFMSSVGLHLAVVSPRGSFLQTSGEFLCILTLLQYIDWRTKVGKK